MELKNKKALSMHKLLIYMIRVQPVLGIRHRLSCLLVLDKIFLHWNLLLPEIKCYNFGVGGKSANHLENFQCIDILPLSVMAPPFPCFHLFPPCEECSRFASFSLQLTLTTIKVLITVQSFENIACSFHCSFLCYNNSLS